MLYVCTYNDCRNVKDLCVMKVNLGSGKIIAKLMHNMNAYIVYNISSSNFRVYNKKNHYSLL